MPYFVYILRSSTNELYIGQTNNLNNRETQQIAKSTKAAKFIKDIEPEYFTEIITYQATAEEAIESWAKYPENDFLTGGKYKYGCTAVGNGYGVLVGGYGDIAKAREENINYSPKMYEPGPNAEFL